MADRVRNLNPAALRLVRRFRRQILSGRLRPGDRLPSVRQLARMDGVGIRSANLALQQMEEEGWARRREGGYILRVAEDATVHAAAQLEHEPPAIVTIVSPLRIRSGDVHLIDEFSEGILREFPGCALRMCYLDRRCWLGQLRQLLDQESRMQGETGFLLRSVAGEVQQFFAAASVPCVVVGEADPTLRLPCIHQDMVQAGAIAGRVLLRTGRAVALCHAELAGGEVRLPQGLQIAAAELGCPAPTPQEFYHHLPPEPEQYIEAIDRLLANSPPGGILALRPEFALATLKAAAERGIAIPDQLQVIGYPQHPMYRFTHPELTSIGIPSMSELGQHAAHMLAACMGAMPEEAWREVVPSVLTERGSTLPLDTSDRDPSTIGTSADAPARMSGA